MPYKWNSFAVDPHGKLVKHSNSIKFQGQSGHLKLEQITK